MFVFLSLNFLSYLLHTAVKLHLYDRWAEYHRSPQDATARFHATFLKTVNSVTKLGNYKLKCARTKNIKQSKLKERFFIYKYSQAEERRLHKIAARQKQKGMYNNEVIFF